MDHLDDDDRHFPVFDEIVDMSCSGTRVSSAITSDVECAHGHSVGKHTGQVKWWNDKLGFGFATICDDGPERGRDVFVHHTGIRPMNSSYRTLRKGEYVSFNIAQGLNGQQAIEVTGVCGGMLMCDAQQQRHR